MIGKNTSMKSLLIGAMMLVLAGSGCNKASPPESAIKPAFDPGLFDGARAFREAEGVVGLGSRDAGTPGALKAAQYLAIRLKAQGVEARIDEFTNDCPMGAVVFRNVIGRLPGQGKGLIILGSHYDTKSGIPGFQGANDSAASSGALIELAGALARGPQVEPEILLVFFDGEECMKHYGPNDGLQGSRHMAEQLTQEGRVRKVKAMILLDMIGDKDLSVTIPRNGTPRLVSQIFDAARDEGVRGRFSLYPYNIGDDHEPFFLSKMPAADIIDFQYGSAPGRNDYWHTAQDTLDKISADSLATVGRVVIRTINKL